VSQVTLCATRTAAGLLALLLSACAGSKPAPPACPTVLLLKGAERTASYRTSGARPADLQHLAVLKNLISACGYDETGAEIALRFELIAEQGPAYPAGNPLGLTYFVATLDPDQAVLSKPLLTSEILFAEGQNVAGNVEEVTVLLPGVAPADGGQYRVYIGFQLDGSELSRRLEH
jgi:hypothetical protein